MSKPPVDEKEQLRRLTRELHEAAKDAYSAAKVLRLAYKETEADTERMLQRLVDEAFAALNIFIGKAEGQSRDHYARILGRADAGGLVDEIVHHVYNLLVPEVNDVLATLGRDIRIQKVDRRPMRPPTWPSSATGRWAISASSSTAGETPPGHG